MNIQNKTNKKLDNMEKWLKKINTKQEVNLLNKVKKEILKNLNKSQYYETYAKCVVNLVFDKEITKIKCGKYD